MPENRSSSPLNTLGLNPVWLLWGVGGAHNDLLMLAALTAAATLALAGAHGRAGAALAAAVAVKASAGLALPFVLLKGRWPALRGESVGPGAPDHHPIRAQSQGAQHVEP